MPDVKYLIPKIDPKVFKMERQPQQVTQNKAQEVQDETKQLPIITGCKAYPDIPQGIEVSYQNIPYPRKGFPDADIINVLNIVKKDTLSYISIVNKYLIPEFIGFGLKPWKWKIRTIEGFLESYLNKADYWLTFWYYKEEFYCPFAREIQRFIQSFLINLGIRQELSMRCAWVWAMFMEHDDAYRLFVQDMFNEVNILDLKKSPGKEIKRLFKLLQEREVRKDWQRDKKFAKFVNLLLVSFYISRIKKAFKTAINEVNWENLRFDEGDKYWSLTWLAYNAQGLTVETRQLMLKQIHKDLPIPLAVRI